ncbi:MAG: MFS transporter [Candidatus ainarchaeum sp.]|nr:MFS transporter [Candidatus ainarchaeum sp.]
MEFRKTLVFALVSGFISAVLSISIPLYLDSLGYSLPDIGYILGFATILSALIGIALAALGDHLGRRLLIIFYSGAMAAGTAIMAFIPSPIAFITGRAISSFAGNNQWNTLLARVSDLSRRENRAAMVGTYTAAFALSYSVSHLIAGAIIDNFGFLAAFSAAIATMLLLAGLAALFLEVGSRKHRFHLSFNVLRTWDGKLNMLVSFCTGFTNIAYMYVMYLFFTHRYGFDATQTGFFIAATFIIWSISSYLIGPYIDRNGLKKAIFLGAILNSAAWFAAVWFQDLLPFLFILAIDNITWPLYGLGVTKISTIIPERENIGRDVSIFGFAHVCGIIAASFLGGVLAEMSFGHAFAARAVAVLLGGCIVFFLMKTRD